HARGNSGSPDDRLIFYLSTGLGEPLLLIGLGGVLFLGHCARKSLSLYGTCRHKNYLVQSHNEPGVQLYSAAISTKAANLQVTHTRMFDALLAWY
ncbi:hypothetical protein ACV1D6_06535, partial [Aeromonas veronii]